MTRKVLGRGLSALLPTDINLSSGEELLEIDIDLIFPNADQPRTNFTDENLQELANSIRENGIVQPIIVRRKGGQYEIVAGERRWRASQIAELRKIPAVVKDVSDDKMLELALIENIQRQELNAIEEAKAFKKLIETLGLTQELVAQRIGKERSYVTTYLRLLRLPHDLQQLVVENRISVGHARALLSLEDENGQRQMARNIIETSLSVRETEKAVKRVLSGNEATKPQPKPKKEQSANVKAAETKLRRRFGTQVRIVSNSDGTGGKIELEYYGEADLDRIYQMLMLSDASVN